MVLARHIVLGVAPALALIAVLQWSGVIEAIDGVVYRNYYQLRGARSSHMGVVLVEVDDRSIRAWGPLPWPQRRYIDLVSTIGEGGPQVIALVEPSALVWLTTTRTIDPALARAPGIPVIAPPLTSPTSDRPRAPGARGVVEELPVTDDQGNPTLLGRILAHAGQDSASRSVAINYLGPDARVPLISAIAVAEGTAHPSAFRDKTVLIGMADTEIAAALATPVGPMTWAEILANAVIAVDDDAALIAPGAVVSWLVVTGYLALASLLFYRRRLRAMAMIGGLWILAPLALGFSGFAIADVTIGIAGPLIGLAMVFLAAIRLNEAEPRRRLGRIARRALERAAQHASEDDRTWHRMARMSAVLFEAHSSMLAELPADRAELQLHALHGAGADDIAERNRDVTRAPFAEPYRTRRSVVAEDFMSPDLEVSTLIAPLVIESRAIGFWILNFPRPRWPTLELEELILTLAGQVARDLEDRRRSTALSAPRRFFSWADGSMTYTVDAVTEETRTVAAERRQANALLAEMPVGAVVASPWLVVESLNHRMRQALAEHGLTDIDKLELVPLLQALLRQSADTVGALLRQAAEHGDTVPLPVPGSPWDFAVTWMAPAESRQTSRDDALPRARFIVTATRRDASRATGPESSSVTFDPRIATIQALGRAGLDTTGDARPARIELGHPMIMARGDSATAAAVMDAILRDAARHGRSDIPCLVAIENEGDRVVITISDSSYAIPQSALPGLLRPSADDDGGQGSLIRAREQLQAMGGDLEVESYYGSGVVFRLELRAAR